MKDQFASVGRTEVLAILTSVSTPTSVLTVDTFLRSAGSPIDERIATIRNATREGSLHGSCGGVGGGWGD